MRGEVKGNLWLQEPVWPVAGALCCASPAAVCFIRSPKEAGFGGLDQGEKRHLWYAA